MSHLQRRENCLLTLACVSNTHALTLFKCTHFRVNSCMHEYHSVPQSVMIHRYVCELTDTAEILSEVTRGNLKMLRLRVFAWSMMACLHTSDSLQWGLHPM